MDVIVLLGANTDYGGCEGILRGLDNATLEKLFLTVVGFVEYLNNLKSINKDNRLIS